VYCQSDKWKRTFEGIFKTGRGSRNDKLRAIKKTFTALDIRLTPPRIVAPIITFGTWKGGDRDGNPFVVASFTNQTFVDQKEFVLERYIKTLRHLIDKLTPSIDHISSSEELLNSIKKDQKSFPYVSDIKPHEPYRCKIRYILEKLENTLTRVKEVKKRAGETTKPLLGQTLVGPSGYNSAHQLLSDIDVIYDSLVQNGGKAQGRSSVQDIKILVETFGFHMASIDFRQLSTKNSSALKEYLTAISHPQAATFDQLNEKDKQAALVSLIRSEYIEMDPYAISSLSKISRDTLETMLIFADAARTDPRTTGKFIISMCQNASDVLTMLMLMKLVGMLITKDGEISSCDYDVTGLFETVDDLKSAPRIIEDLMAIDFYREYVVKLRGGKLTVMMGYSDSVRDGSSLAADSQVIRTAMALKSLEEILNSKYDTQPRLEFIYYRGRGDTIPRGFGGSITKAIGSQLITRRAEDHTEQNRYLRVYASVPSAVHHFHSVYSAHISSQVNEINFDINRYQSYFEFFGKISNIHWNTFVRGPVGKIYFDVLIKYSILPHLHKSHFASRPIAREGDKYDIDKIRAIPFTMDLAQLREFTVAYYGTGTAFAIGEPILSSGEQGALRLLRELVNGASDNKEALDQLLEVDDILERVEPKLAKLLRFCFAADLSSASGRAQLIERALAVEDEDSWLVQIIDKYNSKSEGINEIAGIVLDLLEKKLTVVDVLREMYRTYPPFRYSMENKETALIIRNKKVVDEYTKEASAEEKTVLNKSEHEAQLTREWILKISEQQTLTSKTLKQDFNSSELFLLHKIQSKLMREYRATLAKKQALSTDKTLKQEQIELEYKQLQRSLDNLSVYIQMTILAVSEALGFGG
jgi:phosphoenolpyruvate carboxylase